MVNVIVEPGSGPPVILISGCGMPSYAWDPVARLLAGHELVRLDRPGLGGTPWPDHLPTLAEETATLVDLAEEHPGGVLRRALDGVVPRRGDDPAPTRSGGRSGAGRRQHRDDTPATDRRRRLARGRAGCRVGREGPTPGGPGSDRGPGHGHRPESATAARSDGPAVVRHLLAGRRGGQRHRGVRGLPTSGAGPGPGPGGDPLAVRTPGRGADGEGEWWGEGDRRAAGADEPARLAGRRCSPIPSTW